MEKKYCIKNSMKKKQETVITNLKLFAVFTIKILIKNHKIPLKIQPFKGSITNLHTTPLCLNYI